MPRKSKPSTYDAPAEYPQGKAIKVKAEHKVLYRATQITLSAPCFQRPALKVGMRVAVLENRHEFYGPTVPEPIYYAAKVTAIGEGIDPLVTLEYENHPSAVSLMAGMKDISSFCIMLKK